MRVMIWPMVWKEWRENTRWAVLALVALALALGYSLYAANLNTSSDPASALWNGVAPVFLFGCPLLGAALGFAQVMPELRRDQWAYLVHRPVPRTTLFWGKAAVGLALALGATALPLGLLGVWAALPGDVAAPFDIHLLLPGVAALLTIIPFYFAGMLLALRPARWYGSRPLPLVAAVLAAILTRTLPEFWMAALAALIFGAVLCLAAWGCFAAKGEYAGLPRLARAGLGTSLYVGVGMSLMALVGLTVAVVSSVANRDRAVISAADAQKTYYDIGKSGVVRRVSVRPNGDLSMTDLSGHFLPSSDTLGGAELISENDRTAGLGPGISYTDTKRLFVPMALYWPGESPKEEVNWYYVGSERRALGYALKTRRVVQYFGPAGFSPVSRPASPRFEADFPSVRGFTSYEGGDRLGVSILRFPKTVYWMGDGTANSPLITLLYRSSRMGEIAGASELTASDELTLPLVAVAAQGRFFIFTAQGHPLFSVPREHNPALYDTVTVFVTGNRRKFFFWYGPSDKVQKSGNPSLRQLITETNAAGTVTHRYILPPLPAPPAPPSDTSSAFYFLFVPPLLTLPTGFIFDKGFYGDPVNVPLWHLSLVMSLLSGIISAVLMGLISRRCGDTRRVQTFWAVAGLPLGLFGVLMLLALRPWPVRLPCPKLRAAPRCGPG